MRHAGCVKLTSLATWMHSATAVQRNQQYQRRCTSPDHTRALTESAHPLDEASRGTASSYHAVSTYIKATSTGPFRPRFGTAGPDYCRMACHRLRGRSFTNRLSTLCSWPNLQQKELDCSTREYENAKWRCDGACSSWKTWGERGLLRVVRMECWRQK